KPPFFGYLPLRIYGEGVSLQTVPGYNTGICKVLGREAEANIFIHPGSCYGTGKCSTRLIKLFELIVPIGIPTVSSLKLYDTGTVQSSAPSRIPTGQCLL